MEVTFLTNRDEERIVADKLLFTEQSLTEEQQSQVRTNIGAIGVGELPSTLPNPHKLTLTGAVSAEYDGSEEVEVEIPAGGGGGIPIPETAGVGQTIVVKAVDENGKPTEWEVADLPSGGGGAEWKLVADITLEEDVDRLTLNTDAEGNSFMYNELFIRYGLVGHGSGNYESRYSDLNVYFSGAYSGGTQATFTGAGNGYDNARSSIYAIYPKAIDDYTDSSIGYAIGTGGKVVTFKGVKGLTSANFITTAGLKAGSRIIVYGR